LPNIGHVEREKTGERDVMKTVYGLHNKVILYKLMTKIHEVVYKSYNNRSDPNMVFL